MAITAPPELKYGYVVGKIVRTIADDIDADFFPDTVPASGQVTFKPVKTTSNTTNYPAIVLHESVTGILQDSTGELYASTGDKGVWLVVGTYDVVFNLNFGTLSGFQITVTEAHTKTKPLDLALYRPTPSDPATKFVVNEQIYINTLAEADRATAEATKSATEAAKSKTEAAKAKTEADRAASQVDTKLAALKASGEITGPAGPSNVLSIGTVSATTGNPSATITGTSPRQTLNLSLKTGATGAKGDKGDQGIQGIQGLKGDKGDQGIQGAKGDTGDIGPANVLSVGTVSATTGNPSATITGTSPNQTLNLTLKTGATGPKGDKGDTGEQGPKGDKGDQGTGLNVLGSFSDPSQLPTIGNPGDAYLIGGDLWVWSETTSKYVNAGSVKGDKGDQGDPGLDSALPLREIPATSSPATDLNTVLNTGIYPFTSSTHILNNPTDGQGAGVVVVTPFSFTNSTYRIQEITYYGSKRRYIRATNTGDTGWNDWRELAGTEVATSTSDGLMSKSDKATLDKADANIVASSIVKRWSSGAIMVPLTATGNSDATSKNYVDGADTSTLNSAKSYADSKVSAIAKATASVDGLMPKEDKALLDTNTTSATASALVKRDSNAQINVPSTPTSDSHAASKRYVDSLTPTIPIATSTVDGLMASTDKSKLDGVEAGAKATFKSADITDATTTGKALLTSSTTADARSAIGAQSTLSSGSTALLTTGTSTSNYIWSPKAIADYVKAATPTIPLATSSVDGLMDNTDKSKLDGIEAGAKATFKSADITDATDHAKALLTSTSTSTARSAIGAQSTLSTGTSTLLSTGTSTTSTYAWSPKVIADYVKDQVSKVSIADATQTVSGLMSAADKILLDKSTSDVTPSTIVQRDSTGSVKTATPTTDLDATNKAYVDSVSTAELAWTEITSDFAVPSSTGGEYIEVPGTTLTFTMPNRPVYLTAEVMSQYVTTSDRSRVQIYETTGNVVHAQVPMQQAASGTDFPVNGITARITGKEGEIRTFILKIQRAKANFSLKAGSTFPITFRAEQK